MKTYMKVIAVAILWLSGWSYLMSYEGKFDPGVNGLVGRKEFLEALGSADGQTAMEVAAHINDSLQLDPITFTKSVTTKDSMWIGTMEGSTFRDLNIKSTIVSKAIRIEEVSGTEAYEIGVEESGSLIFYDDDGSRSLTLHDVSRKVAIADSLWVGKTSRFTGDMRAEADLNVEGQFTSTLSLDLEDYFGRNVRQLMATVGDDADDYVDWADNKWDDAAAGVHSDNATNYLTDHQSMTLTDGDDNDGIHLDFTDIDLTLFADGDTSVMADYINWNIYILTQDIADLNDTDGLGLIFACDAQGTLTNYFYYLMDDDDLSNGWNYFKVAKSAFTGVGTAVGDSMWNTITGVSLYLDGAPDAEVIVSIDNIQMVRDDPDAAEPNPFQSEGPNGTWVADWTQEGNGNVTLVEESGVLSVFTPEDGQIDSYLRSVKSYGDYSASGVWRVSASPYLFQYAENRHLRLTVNTVELRDSSATFHSKAFTYADGDLIYWRFTRRGTSVTGQVSHTGLSGDWTTVSTFGHAEVKQVDLYFEVASRLYLLGFSSVEYADEAGLAYRWFRAFERGDTLFVRNVGAANDSLGFILIDGYVKE